MDFRPIEAEDIRYAWAGYKAGSLVDMGPPLNAPGLTADLFKQTFEQVVVDRYSGAWTMFAMTRKGFIPAGMVFAFYSHKDAMLSPFMVIGDIVWFPWATRRNKIECAVNFFNRIRKEIPMVDYAYGEANKKFMEMIAHHGALRRIGTTYNVVRGEPVAIFETRTG